MSNELVDICFNFTHQAFRDDEQDILQRALDAGVRTMMVTGSSVEESRDSIELSQRYPEYLWATVGVHPHLAKEWNQNTSSQLRELAAQDRVKAIGEAGLDYNRNYSPHNAQRHAFEQQIELACESGLPLFLHERDAHDDFVSILKAYRADLGNVVVHCFTGNGDQLDTYLAMDLHIGITGWICDERRGHHLHELVKQIPPNRMMLETDAPYLVPRDLSPPPKARRNEPAFLPHILKTVSRHLELPSEQIAKATTHTATQFYGLK